MPEDLITSEVTGTHWIDTEYDFLDNDKCPKPDRGETDTSDELRDLATF